MNSYDYIFVKSWQTTKGATGQTAYILPEYDGGADAETLIHQSTACLHPSLVDTTKMKKKRYVGTDVLYGVN